MILVDTSVLSLAFRRKRRDLNPDELRAVFALEELFNRGYVVIIGPIRQELLSGVSHREQFDRLKYRLLVLDDLSLGTETFVQAAEFYNKCVAAGIAPGPMDMTIAAAAHLRDTPIFTTDPDFQHYAKHLPITLFKF